MKANLKDCEYVGTVDISDKLKGELETKVNHNLRDIEGDAQVFITKRKDEEYYVIRTTEVAFYFLKEEFGKKIVDKIKDKKVAEKI